MSFFNERDEFFREEHEEAKSESKWTDIAGDLERDEEDGVTLGFRAWDPIFLEVFLDDEVEGDCKEGEETKKLIMENSSSSNVNDARWEWRRFISILDI